MSNRHLVILFFVAFSVFSLMRWDVEGALHRGVLPRVEKLLVGYGLHAGRMELQGSVLRLEGVSVVGVTMPDGRGLTLDEVVVTPLWWHSLTRLEPVIHLVVRWRDGVFEGDLSEVTGVRPLLRALHFRAPVLLLKPWLPPLPVSVSGLVLCNGRVRVDVQRKRPETPDLRCDWSDATVAVGGGAPTRLGLYHLVITTAKQGWSWGLKGGKVVQVDGQGVIQKSDAPMSRWKLDGSVSIRAGEGSLGTMITAVVGAGRHHLSGSLGAPVLQ